MFPIRHPVGSYVGNFFRVYIYIEVTDIPRFVKKSNWISKPSKYTRLESVIDLIKSDIKHSVDVHVPKTDNLTQAERSALRNIQEKDDIIIKPADKGSAVVVMDKTTYLQKAETTVRLSILRKI